MEGEIMADPWEELATKYGGSQSADVGDSWAALSAKYSQPQAAEPSAEQPAIPTPAQDVGNRLSNFVEGAGLMLKAPFIGGGNFIDIVPDERVKEFKAQVNANAGKPGGFGGQIIGGAIPAAGLSFLPGGSSMAGAAAYNGLYGAMQPAESAGERAINAGAGAVGGFAGQALGQGLKAGTQRFLTAAEQKAAAEASRNSVRDTTLAEAQAAGYVVPPSMADSGVGSRLLEGLSGKYKTNQLAGIKNQEVTDRLLRQSVGLPNDAPLTSEAMQNIRRQAYKAGYEPVASAGKIKTDQTFLSDLDGLVANHQGAARSFPGAVRDDVTNLVEGVPGMHGGPRSGGLKVAEFDGGDAIKMAQILRDEASAAYRAGDTALGQAKKGAAKAIEDQIERGLAAKGEDGAALLKQFRDARTLMAKTHTAEDAIREGGGVADAKVLGRRVQQGKPLTGEQATIGKFANNFGDVAGIPKSGNANPLTVLDYAAGAGGAGWNPLLLSLPAMRIGARYGILSQPYQKAFVNPGSYGPGFLPLLPGRVAKTFPALGASGGLLATPND